MRQVDDYASPLRIRIPARGVLQPATLRGALDRGLVRRVWALRGLATRIDDRIERFLAVTGSGTVVGARAPVQGPGLEMDLELTEG